MDDGTASEMGAVGKAFLALNETGEARLVGRRTQEKHPREPIGYYVEAKAIHVSAESSAPGPERRRLRFRAAESANFLRDYARHRRRLDLRSQAEAIIRLAPRDGPRKIRYGRLSWHFREADEGKKKTPKDSDSVAANLRRAVGILEAGSKTGREVLGGLAGASKGGDVMEKLKKAGIHISAVLPGELKKGRTAQALPLARGAFAVKLDRNVVSRNRAATLAPLLCEALDNALYQKELSGKVWSSVLMHLRGRFRAMRAAWELQDAGQRFHDDTRLARRMNFVVRLASKPDKPIGGGQEGEYYGASLRTYSLVLLEKSGGKTVPAMAWEAYQLGIEADVQKGLVKRSSYVGDLRRAREGYVRKLADLRRGARSRPIPSIRK